MKHVFENPLQRPISDRMVENPNETAVRILLRRVTTMVDELENHARLINADAPATARHLRLVTQQLATLTLTAVETWPKAR